MVSRALAIFFAVTTGIFGYLYLQEQRSQPQKPAHANIGQSTERPATRTTPNKKIADVSHINVTVTAIRDGVAHITIRNNNPYPIRGISTIVNYNSVKKKSHLPEYTQHVLVEDLITAGQELEFQTLDTNMPRRLVTHGIGAVDEWIPVASFEFAEVERIASSNEAMRKATLKGSSPKIRRTSVAPD